MDVTISEFIHRIIPETERIVIASSGLNTETKVYKPETVEIREYTYNFQIYIPEDKTLLTINKDTIREYGFANTLHADETRYIIKTSSTIGYIYTNDSEILFDSSTF